MVSNEPKLNPGTVVQRIRFPVFGVSWSNDAICYCGGGGSSKTGVHNSIVVMHTPTTTTTTNTTSNCNDATATTTIDTGDEVCIAVALHPQNTIPHVLCAVGKQVQIYHTITKHSIGAYNVAGAADETCEGVCAVAYSSDGAHVLAGCENGTVLSFALQSHQQQQPPPTSTTTSTTNTATTPENDQIIFHLLAECHGHEKALCSITYNPKNVLNNNLQCLSAAKDGTARVWDARTGQCLAVIHCSVDQDGNDGAVSSKQKKRDNVIKKKPTQILVRGCAYGSDGVMIYTVASGRRGKAFVSQWKLLPCQMQTPQTPQTQQQQQQQQQQHDNPGYNSKEQESRMTSTLHPPFLQPEDDALHHRNTNTSTSTKNTSTITKVMKYAEVGRICCSNVPISASSLSADTSTFYLGNVEGAIIIMAADTLRIRDTFHSIHDLPVTCMSSRPLRYNYSNNKNATSNKTAESFNGGQIISKDVAVLTGSGDSKIVFLSMKHEPLLSLTAILYCVLFLCIIALVIYVSYVQCGSYINDMIHFIQWNTRGNIEFRQCLKDSLVAPYDTPGVYSIPV